MLCGLNEQIYKLKWINLMSYPDTSGPLFFKDKRKIMTPTGDAFLVKICSRINHFKVIWERRLDNKTCYKLYPVKIGNRTKFLELLSRQVVASSPKMECGAREKVVYIKDKKGGYWKYVLGKGFMKVKVKNPKYFSKEIQLPKLGSFNKRLIHYDTPQLHRRTLLGILADQQDNLETLTDLRKEGGDNIILGILKKAKQILATTISAGTDALGILTGGVVSTLNNTVLALDNSEEILVGFFDGIGGPSIFTLYILNIAIIGYFVYKWWMERRQQGVRLEVKAPQIPMQVRKPFIRDREEPRIDSDTRRIRVRTESW